METITPKTSKDEILSSACELTDWQASTIDRLKQQQGALALALALAVALHLI